MFGRKMFFGAAVGVFSMIAAINGYAADFQGLGHFDESRVGAYPFDVTDDGKVVVWAV
ncbi:hypothetical protein JD969_04820 [Planctomycetota bacterium]|nr:hypothetical protein JD969_04820 [Planctomycetota bacterium]